MNKSLTLALIELILTHGPNAAIYILRNLEIDNPTPEQIKSLTVKSPESFFNTGSEDGK